MTETVCERDRWMNINGKLMLANNSNKTNPRGIRDLPLVTLVNVKHSDHIAQCVHALSYTTF
jgi:hypothetical protein